MHGGLRPCLDLLFLCLYPSPCRLTRLSSHVKPGMLPSKPPELLALFTILNISALHGVSSRQLCSPHAREWESTLSTTLAFSHCQQVLVRVFHEQCECDDQGVTRQSSCQTGPFPSNCRRRTFHLTNTSGTSFSGAHAQPQAASGLRPAGALPPPRQASQLSGGLTSYVPQNFT